MEAEGVGNAVTFFGVAMDSRFRGKHSEYARERLAYEHLLKKFDDFLARQSDGDMGWVVHDQRIVAEKDVREWTRGWQQAAGALGQINRFADLPLFADSRSTRLLQVADLVAYALWRAYDTGNSNYLDHLWPQFDILNGRLHGAIHLTPDFAGRRCNCKPCFRRNTGSVSAVE